MLPILPLLLVQDPSLLDLLPEAEPDARAAAFAEVTRERDPAHLPPLLDLLALSDTPEEWYRVLDAIGAITGQPQRDVERPWRTNSLAWFDREERPLPPDYLAFKRELYTTRLSPAFGHFLDPENAPFPRLDELTFGGVVPGDIPALDHPPHVPADEADFLPPHAPVIGVVAGGEARAYPNRILDWHELANDTLGGRRFALTWCTLCGAAIAYDATPVVPDETEGTEPLHFDTSGLLLRSNKLMFDAATESLWNQLTGEAASGPMARRGARLRVLPTVHTTFAAWRAEHPETTVVTPNTGHDRDYTEGAAYGEYFASPETMFPTPNQGRRFAPKERVVVILVEGERHAVPLSVFDASDTYYATLGGSDVRLVDRTPKFESALPAVWRETLVAQEVDPDAPSLEELEAAATSLGESAPLLSMQALLGLPRATRSGVLAGGFPLEAGARSDASVRHLAADVRAFDAEGRPLPTHLAFGFAIDASNGL